MPPEFIVDAGPLIAYFHPRDEHHAWAVETFKQINSRLITCEPVLTEAFYMLSDLPNGIDLMAGFCASDALQVDFRVLNEIAAVRELLHKYRNVPMDLADGCLVFLAEEHPQASIITTDRDFLLYRTRSRRQLRLIAPFST